MSDIRSPHLPNAKSQAERTDPYTEFERKICFGMVLSAVAGVHGYLVQTSVNGTLTCTCMGMNGGFNGGVRSEGLLSAGTFVVVLRTGDDSTGMIIGAVPYQANLKSKSANAAGILINGGSSLVDEQQHKQQLKNFADRGSGRSMDALPGDAGSMSPLGVGWFASPFSMLVRGSDLAHSLYSFTDDSVKNVAWNLINMNSHGQAQFLEDEGELHGHTACTFFPWESRGAFLPNAPQFMPGPLSLGLPVVEGTDALAEADVPEDQRKRFVQVVPGQMAVPRFQKFDGYLGFGRHRVLACPSELAFTQPAETSLTPSTYSGLWSESVGMDGRHTIKSATGILLEKTLDIPVPKQRLDPADPQGDTGDDVSWSGVYGTKPGHKLTQFPLAKDGSLDQADNAARHVWDYVNNQLQALLKHVKDWSVSTAGATDTTFGGVTISPEFFILAGTRQELPRPTPLTLRIALSPNVARRIYKSRAYIEIQDDGSIVAEDGYGAQYVLSRGNVKITAAQDMQIIVGRDFRVLAGGDVLLLGNKNVDISASTQAVRIKGQTQVQIAAITQGVLLDGRGAQPVPAFNGALSQGNVYGGVVINSPNAPALVYAKKFGLYTGGDVTIDANAGRSDVKIVANNIGEVIAGTRSELYGASPSSGASTSSTSIVKNAQTVSVGQQKTAFKNVDAQALVALTVSTPSLEAATAMLATASIAVASIASPIIPAGPAAGAVAGSPAGAVAAQAVGTVTAKIAAQVITGLPTTVTLADYAIHSIVENIGFSFRADTEYNAQLTSGVLAAPWQLQRTGVSPVWSEPAVSIPSGGDSRPWPGTASWQAAGSYIVPVVTKMTSKEAAGLVISGSPPVPAIPVPKPLLGNLAISC